MKAAFGFNYDITSAVQAVQDRVPQFSHQYCIDFVIIDKQYLEKAPFNWEACVERSSLTTDGQFQ